MADRFVSEDIPASASLRLHIALGRTDSIAGHFASDTRSRTTSSLTSGFASRTHTAAMGTLVAAPNKALDGHLLLITAQFEPPKQWLDRVHASHPGLRIIFRAKQFDEVLPRSVLTDDEWSDVTVLLGSGIGLPQPEDVPKLQYVQLTSAGANLVLKQPIFADTNIIFATANGVHGPQITEWIIATYLSFNHKLTAYLDYQRAGKWVRNLPAPEDSVGHRVGILGYGSIGRQTARVAKALAFDVYAYTLHPRETPESKRDNGYAVPGTGDPEGIYPSRWFSGGSRADLHAFLSSGLDLLVVATPLTDGTAHLLGAEEFKLLGRRQADGSWRPGFLSNIARGPVVDTDALIEALDQGVLRGAALDVTDPEPLPDGHPLWSAKNVVITPHVSGNSVHYGERVLDILADNLDRLSEGRKLANIVNRREGY